MLPKDLLEHLEKGDRTMEHLTNSVTISTSTQAAGELNQAFQDAFGQTAAAAWGQLGQANNRMWVTGSSVLGNSQMTAGGIIRW